MSENKDKTAPQNFSSLRQGSTDSRAVEAYYDGWAQSYDETLSNWRYSAPDDAAESLAPLLQAGQSVLDVGCGTGLFAKALRARIDCRVTGLDISTASLKIAEETGAYAGVRQHDLQQMPLPLGDNTMDAAGCVGVMTYIEDVGGLLRDLCRIVRPGGPILFTQRDDLWQAKGLDAILERLQADGLTAPAQVVGPLPYLPDNEDFREDIRVYHVLLRCS